MWPFIAHCHIGLAKHYRDGNQERAQEHLSIGTMMYRDMDMRGWLEAESETGQVH